MTQGVEFPALFMLAKSGEKLSDLTFDWLDTSPSADALVEAIRQLREVRRAVADATTIMLDDLMERAGVDPLELLQ